MRWKKVMGKWIAGLLAGAVLFISASGIKAAAAEKSYTVTYRAGNVGYFAMDGTKETDKKEMAREVAKLLYSDNQDITGIQVTDHGAIKLSVKKGAGVPKAPGTEYVQTKTGYFVKAVSEWGAAAGETVDRNLEYVVDYGKLVDGVEYTVSYIDDTSKSSIAPIAIAYGKVGDRVENTAPSVITISGGTKYLLQGSATKNMTLTADSTENVLVFPYSKEPTGTKVNEIVQYEEGDIVVVTQRVTVSGESRGAVLASGQNRTEAVQNSLTQSEENVSFKTASKGAVTTVEEEQTVLHDASEKSNSGAYMGLATAAALLFATGSAWIRYRHNAK